MPLFFVFGRGRKGGGRNGIEVASNPHPHSNQTEVCFFESWNGQFALAVESAVHAEQQRGGRDIVVFKQRGKRGLVHVQCTWGSLRRIAPWNRDLSPDAHPAGIHKHTGASNIGQDKTRQDTTRQDKTRQDKTITRQDNHKTRQSQDKTRQGQGKARQNNHA